MLDVPALEEVCKTADAGGSYRYSNFTVSSAEKERSLRPGRQSELCDDAAEPGDTNGVIELERAEGSRGLKMRMLLRGFVYT